MTRAAHILRTIWTHAVISLSVLFLCSVSLSLFFSWFLPENVNAVFLDYVWKCSLILAAISFIVFFVVFKRTRANKLTLGDSIEKVGAIGFILVLLPLKPIVQYIINNQDILSPSGSVYILAVFAVFSVLLVVVIPTLIGIGGSTKTLMVLGMAFAFMITNMASLSATYNWFGAGSIAIQLGIFGAIFLGGRLLYSHRTSRKFLYIFVVIFFITGIALQFAPGERGSTMPASTNQEMEDNKLLVLVGSKEPLSTPNIYLLVYDAYLINEIMLQHGIDNSAQEEYLEELGFKLYPHTYSVGAGTIATMSRILNASSEYCGNPRRGVSGDGVVQNLLRSFGYETLGIFPTDYEFRGFGSSYDFSFPTTRVEAVSSAHKLLVKAIFMGEFRFDVEFDSPSREQFVQYKITTFENVSSEPRFVYMHDNLPNHSQNSGACLPDETELFGKRLIQANYQMKQDIETIIQNDPGAIIIVASDHGPYLTKNCNSTSCCYDISEINRLDIQDRFGTFLAIKWPTEDYSEYDDITVIQDIFPLIFAYLFEDDEFLEAKIEPDTLDASVASGAQVKNCTIYGGVHDGESLFASRP